MSCHWAYNCTLIRSSIVFVSPILCMEKGGNLKKKKKKGLCFYFFTHIFQPPVGLLMPVRETAEKRCGCVWEKMTIKEQRAWVLGPCAGQWKSWKVRAQSRRLPALHSVSHNSTKAESKNKHTFLKKKKKKTLQSEKCWDWTTVCICALIFYTNCKISQS